MKHIKAYKLFESSSKADVNNVKTIILYHGSPYKFDTFKSQDELGYNHSGHMMSGISFTDDINKANYFAETYPSVYYEDLISLRKSFTNIDKILKKVEYKDNLNRIGSIENLENNIEKSKKKLLTSWERFKTTYDWLDDNKKWEKFEKENKYSLEELETLRSKLKQAKHLSGYSISNSEQVKLDNYNKKLDELNKRYDLDYGFVYTCEITYKDVLIVNGEDVGFGSYREEIINDLDDDYILKINDSDTGKYIGVEFIVPDKNIYNIKILKRNKSKLNT